MFSFPADRRDPFRETLDVNLEKPAVRLASREGLGAACQGPGAPAPHGPRAREGPEVALGPQGLAALDFSVGIKLIPA